MTNEQLRIALVANAVTRSNRIGFDFQDPAGKTLDEYTKEAMMQCVRVAQKMRQPGLDKELAGQVFPIYTIGNWAREKVVYGTADGYGRHRHPSRDSRTPRIQGLLSVAV